MWEVLALVRSIEAIDGLLVLDASLVAVFAVRLVWLLARRRSFDRYADRALALARPPRTPAVPRSRRPR
ncbi:MAG: hypothetical protein ACRDPK_11240 [Carbonactinosporaceae bacterium]